MGSPAWMEKVRDALSGDDATSISRALILCRTQAQAQDVRREIAKAGGFVGLEVNTLRGLAAELMPKSLGDPPKEPLRPDNPLLNRIGKEGERPGLEAHLQSLLAAYRLKKKVDGPIDVEKLSTRMKQLAALAETGFGESDSEKAVAWLLDAASQKNRVSGEVFSLGFDCAEDTGGISRVAPWEKALLSRLSATPLLSFPQASKELIPAAKVPDVYAEARLAVRLLLKANGDKVLVLVPDEVTAGRLAATARRNGVAVSSADRLGYSAHSLAMVLRAALPWFDQEPGNDPVIRASQLEKVLGNPLTGNRFPAKVRKRLIETITAKGAEGFADESSMLRLSARDLNRALAKCRLVEAPLTKWCQRTRDLSEKPPESREPDHRRALTVLHERLSRLQSCILGAEFKVDDVYEDEDKTHTSELPEEQGVVTAAELDFQGYSLPKPGTFGALRRFLVDTGLRIARDWCGKAIVAELANRKNDPLTGRELMRLLGGSASLGILNDGVSVLLYEDYDGRNVDIVIMLGVHNKGIAAVPTPDPILEEPDLRALSLPAGGDVINYRICQAQRAVGRSETIAIVTDRDASGRAVVPPVQLPLSFDPDDKKRLRILKKVGVDADNIRRSSFGKELDLPEHTSLLDCKAKPILTREELDSIEDPSVVPASANDAVGRLCVQANAEWYRQGVGLYLPPKAHRDVLKTGKSTHELAKLSLGEQVAFLKRLGPDAVMPYLGQTGPLPNDWDLEGDGEQREWSVSSRFRPMANCLYRLFAEGVLNISDIDPVSDELDDRETGSLVHRAFELAAREGDGIAWRVAADTEEGAKAALDYARGLARDKVCGILHKEFDGAAEIMDLPAVREATIGLRDRWKARIGRRSDEGEWLGYVAERVRPVTELRKIAHELVMELWSEESDDFEDVLEDLESCLSDWTSKSGNTPKKREQWLKTLLRHLASGKDMPEGKALRFDINSFSPKGEWLQRFLSSNPFRSNRKKMLTEISAAMHKSFVYSEPVILELSELGFGRKAGAPVILPLRKKGLPVRGEIDLVSLVQNEEGEHALSLMDYKTGRRDDHTKEGILLLYKPQLPVYALALEALINEGHPAVGLIPEDATAEQLVYDFVKDIKGLKDKLILSPLRKNGFIAGLEKLVGHVDRGRFWPIAVAKDSWGYPKGAVTLEAAARAVTPMCSPELGPGDESNGEEAWS